MLALLPFRSLTIETHFSHYSGAFIVVSHIAFYETPAVYINHIALLAGTNDVEAADYTHNTAGESVHGANCTFNRNSLPSIGDSD